MAQVLGGVDAHAGRALDERLDAPRRRSRRPRRSSARESVERARVRRVVGGRRDVHAVEEHAREGAAEDLDAAEAGRADGVAVERAVERDEARSLGPPRLLRELHRQLDRDLDRGRAVVAEEDAREARGRDRARAPRRGARPARA